MYKMYACLTVAHKHLHNEQVAILESSKRVVYFIQGNGMSSTRWIQNESVILVYESNIVWATNVKSTSKIYVYIL